MFLQTGVTATAEISVVNFINLSIKTYLEGGNYYAAKLLFSNRLPIAVIFTLNTLSDNDIRDQLCMILLRIAQNSLGPRITCVPYSLVGENGASCNTTNTFQDCWWVS